MTETPLHMQRRSVLSGLGLTGLGLTLGGAFMSPFAGLSLASGPQGSSKRFVLIALRGGLDGLSLFPPYADPDYEEMRGALALAPANTINGVIDLDGFFGLHPAAEPLLKYWLQEELVLLPALGVESGALDHETARRIFDTGSRSLKQSGWMSRTALSMLPQKDLRGEEVFGLAEKLGLLYADAPFLNKAFEGAQAGQDARKNRLRADDQQSDAGAISALRLPALAHHAAVALRQGEGARLAVLECGEWDTHQDQGALVGYLPRRLAALSAAIDALADELGPAWSDTVVLVASEMGRSVRPNGRRGTDNGVGSIGFAVGGAVIGGRVSGEWPGLAPEGLVEGSSLAPRSSLWGVIRAILQRHLGLSAESINTQVLPDFVDAYAAADFLGLPD